MKKYSFIRRIFFAFKQTEKPENWLLQKIKENPFQFFCHWVSCSVEPS